MAPEHRNKPLVDVRGPRPLAAGLPAAAEIADQPQDGAAHVAAGRLPPNNLVLPRSPLIGRHDALAALQQLLLQEHVALLTLTGPGGIGKTRLALQAAANMRSHFADGVYVIALAAINDAVHVLPAMAQVLGVRETGAQPLLEDLQDRLRTKHMLLVLDNFEQVLAAAPAIADLLHACHRVKILVTSRATLRLHDEYTFPVSPLALPDAKQLAGLALGAETSVQQYAAIDLFCQRAAAIQPGFVLTPANALAVAKVCIGLDGLPLAIELAAARLKLFEPGALLARLQERLVLLTGGAHDVPLRQRTLRDEIAWSYNLLRPEEQLLFRRLAVFAGGFKLEAAQAVGNPHDNQSLNVLDLIGALVDQSLVCLLAQTGDGPRLGILETIREYALEQLEASGEAEMVRNSHARYFLAFAEAIEPDLFVHETTEWGIARLQAEFDNLRAAVSWTAQPPTATKLSGDLFSNSALAPAGLSTAEMGLRLAGALSWFALMSKHLGEVRQWLVAALQRTAGPEPARAKALWGAGMLGFFLGDYQTARIELEESSAIYRSLGDQLGLARAWRELCVVACGQRDLLAAQQYGEMSIAILRAIGSKEDLSVAVDNLGAVYGAEGKHAAARMLFEEEITLALAMRNDAGVSIASVGLGWVAAQQGDYAKAIRYLEKALELQPGSEEQLVPAMAQNLLGEVFQRRGELARAGAFYRESLALARATGDKAGVAHVLNQIGLLAFAQRLDPHAVRLLAASAAQQAASGGTIYYSIFGPTDQAGAVVALRARLGEDLYATWWAEGQAMTLERAMALAVEGTEATAAVIPSNGNAPRGVQAPANPANLTTREIAVLRLLVEGLTYAQIADKLVVSTRTVNAHLTSIYSKLDVPSRVAATRVAVQQHLV